MGSLILLLNNDIETKFKGWDTTQSTPQKQKINRYLVYWYSGTCSFKMTGQEINQHLQNPQKKVTSDRTTSCIYLTGSSKNF